MTQGQAPTGGPRPVTPLGILAERLATITGLVEALPQAGDDLREQVRAAHALAAGFEPYLERCTTPASEHLEALARETAAHDWAAAGEPGGPVLEQEMLSGHVEGQLLAFLVRISRARRVLDLGMFTGYSALAMAQALPAGGVVVACELDPGVARFARDAMAPSPAAERVEIRVGAAAGVLQELADAAAEPFDLVFLDADKGGYGDYVNALLATGLLAEDGLLCVDNTLLQGEPWATPEPSANGAAIAAFNDRLAADPRLEQVLVPLRDGLTLARRV